MTLSYLANKLTESNIVCLSIRAPTKTNESWNASSRIDDTGWKRGTDKPTLEEAIQDVLDTRASAPENVTDYEDLLG